MRRRNPRRPALAQVSWTPNTLLATVKFQEGQFEPEPHIPNNAAPPQNERVWRPSRPDALTLGKVLVNNTDLTANGQPLHQVRLRDSFGHARHPLEHRRRALGSLAQSCHRSFPRRLPPGSGSPILGGPIATAGGLIHRRDARPSLRAFDIETGRELWRGTLPQSAKATPMSYRLASGEQFVAIAVGGGGAWGTGDYVVAFRLSD